jgi:hypothetical protein
MASTIVPAILLLVLCGCMLCQCSTCLLKYFSAPLGASVTFSQNLNEFPIAITVCNKDNELNYTFPELGAIEVKQEGPGGANWQTVYEPPPGVALVQVENFLTVNPQQNRLRLCKTINVHEARPKELRLHHFYSTVCNLKKMAVYIHNRGQFFAKDLAIPMPKKLFTNEENLILELIMEAVTVMPSPAFNCSQEDNTLAASGTLDQCLLAEAIQVANQSAGCLSKDLR